MKALTVTVLVWIALARTGLGEIGEDEKQIEARYGKPGKDLGTHGDVHELGYMSGGFMILVDFVNGISQREGFANPDTSPLSPQSVEDILRMSADRKSTRLNSSHRCISYAVFCSLHPRRVHSFPTRRSSDLARYGKPGKDLGTHGDVHELGYMSGGFMILVDFVNGISQREGFANPDTSPLSPQSVEDILRMS